MKIEGIGLAHQADSASYDCLICDEPWPCGPAREHLSATIHDDDRLLLVIQMWIALDEAAMGPLKHVPANALTERFILWLP